MTHQKKLEYFFYSLVMVIAICSVVIGFQKKSPGPATGHFATVEEQQDPSVRLLLEMFDSIKTNYWDKADDTKLAQLFLLATQKVTNASTTQTTLPLRNNLAHLLKESLASKNSADKKQATLAIGELVLTNLEPFGRSHIFTIAQEKSLRDTVSNIDNTKDLYISLNIPRTASKDEIEKKYNEQVAILSKEKTPQAEQKIKDLAYAKNILTDDKQKSLYDTKKIEPTIFSENLSPSILYVNFTKFSPTTFNEFVDTMATIKNTPTLKYMLLDMRGNIGGSLDIVPYLSGLFIGQGQYAFDLFKQGNYIPFKSPTQRMSEIAGLKKTVLLIDGNTQSSAELFASILKKYNRAVIVGTKSKGWGTIENTFPLQTSLDGDKYSLFLVQSITLRDDNLPIEGRGVDPDISILDKNWAATAKNLIEKEELVTALQKIVAAPPRN